MIKKGFLIFLILICNGCATIILSNVEDEKTIQTQLVELYYDEQYLYVQYKANLTVDNIYEKIGKIEKSTLWECAQIPSQKSKLPQTVEHNNTTYTIFEYNPYAKRNQGKVCKSYSGILGINDVNLNTLHSLPVKEVIAIDEDDPTFNEERRSLYAFLVKPEGHSIGKVNIILIDPTSNKVLVMQGLNLPEQHIKYKNTGNSIVKTVGTVPAVAFDAVTFPIQIPIVYYVLKHNWQY